MATPNDVVNVISGGSTGAARIQRVVIRGIFVVTGCLAVAWGLDVLPLLANQAAIEHVANDVIRGRAFKPEALSALTPQLEAAEGAILCRGAGLHSAAVIRLRLVEQAIADDENFDVPLDRLNRTIRLSLACSPDDPFLWAVYYWAQSAQYGFRLDDLAYLRLSYQLGPHEAWIALKRSSFAFAIFQELPPDLADKVVNEFVDLLQTGFVSDAVRIFTGPAWPERAMLLSRIGGVRQDFREYFARELDQKGYDVDVPGVARRDPRPWD